MVTKTFCDICYPGEEKSGTVSVYLKDMVGFCKPGRDTYEWSVDLCEGCARTLLLQCGVKNTGELTKESTR